MSFVFSHDVGLGTFPKLRRLAPQPRKTNVLNIAWLLPKLETRPSWQEAPIAMVSVTLCPSVSGG